MYLLPMLSCLPFLACHGIQNSRAARTIAVEDVHTQVKPDENSLEFFTVTSKSDCSKFCLRNEKCLSINYCDNKFWALNAGDVFPENFSLQNDLHCKYIGMKKEASFTCEEKRSEETFLQDPDSNLCRHGLNGAYRF